MSDTRHLPAQSLVDETALLELVQTTYAIQPRSISPLGGYSNLNFTITDANGAEYVLRIARPNRKAASIADEQRVLHALATTDTPYVPRLVGHPSAIPSFDIQAVPRFVQLTHKLPGHIDCLWWQQCSPEKIGQIFRSLAGLHRKMAAIPDKPHLQVSGPVRPPASPFRFDLPEQAPAILNATPTGEYVVRHWQGFRTAAANLQSAMSRQFPWQETRRQWIHGDIQLENILFHQDRLSAFLDFERTSQDAVEMDAIFSAFRVCKEGNSDAPFSYDKSRLHAGLNAYLQETTDVHPAFFGHYEKYWLPFFCLDQSMVYLENAFDGIWQLAEGIGFLPCFNEVLQYV